jgi:squalene synthase HpnC
LLRWDADERADPHKDRHMPNGTPVAGRSTVASQAAPATVLRAKRRAENFPVALLLLPRSLRRDLRAVYDVTRVIDDLGDQAEGDRTALLHEFRTDLAAVWSGAPSLPVLQRLVPTVRTRSLPEQPFQDLVAANLQDQRVAAYETFDELAGYCRLSADPVGRLVLALFGATTPRTVDLSDKVCTALQLLEFWQDVAEDHRDGRTYLPQQTLRRFGVPDADLSRPMTSPALRAALASETDRAERLLDAGTELVALLHGWARVAVAGYVAGGVATVQALRRERFEVMVGTPRPSKRDTAAAALRLLAGALRGGGR